MSGRVFIHLPPLADDQSRTAAKREERPCPTGNDEHSISEACHPELVKFEHLNLLQDFSRFGSFDIVYCRNVLIYFDEPTKRDILARIANRMNPGGFLVLGAAETIMGLTNEFRTVPGKQGLCMLGGTESGAASGAGGVPSRPAATPSEPAKPTATAGVARPLRVSNA